MSRTYMKFPACGVSAVVEDRIYRQTHEPHSTRLDCHLHCRELGCDREGRLIDNLNSSARLLLGFDLRQSECEGAWESPLRIVRRLLVEIRGG